MDDAIVEDGIFVNNGNLAADVTVNGGIYAGTGISGDVTINPDGTIAPGLSIGTINTGDFTSSGTLQIEVDGAGNSDTINVTGAVDITGSKLDLLSLGDISALPIATSHTIIENDGVDPITGMFLGGVGLNTAGSLFSVANKSGGDGNDLTLDVFRKGIALADGANNSETVAFPDHFGDFTFVVDGTDMATFSGSFSEAGTPVGIHKAGDGTLLMSGVNIYSGDTNVHEGTLQIGSTDAAPKASRLVIYGGTFDLNDFDVEMASIIGEGTVDLGSGTLTVGGDDSSTRYEGTIIGTGGLTKTGSGLLELTGDNTYTGNTTVAGGWLLNNGSLASTVVVNAGFYSGTGSSAGLIVNNGGTVAPGPSFGTLTVNGDVVFGAGSTYQVEIDADGNSDLIAATGTATISGTGTTLHVTGTPASFMDAKIYTILTAMGGVSGEFADLTVTDNLPDLDFGAIYNPNSIQLG